MSRLDPRSSGPFSRQPPSSPDPERELRSLRQEVQRLRRENAELMTLRQELERLRVENQDLQGILTMTAEHGDTIQQELQAANARLRFAAEVDGLTQIANRRKFDQYWSAQWQCMMQIGHPLGVILCDIDYFKQYNDFYGHLGGDDCLRQVATALKGAIKRADDLLARYGGEEFVAVLPSTGLEQAKIVADRMGQAVRQLQLPHRGSPIHSQVTVSLGVASGIPQPHDSPRRLVDQADHCLYHAKTLGRNQVVFSLELS
jgi:diguanylate cyclase (GGDEF)-like protein